jgi:hypothetical protein
MAGIADDVIDRLTSLSLKRTDFEWAWRQVQKVAAPDGGNFDGNGASAGGFSGLLPMANATRRSKDIYDSTAVWAVDRLASGIEALIIPQSEYWHNFDLTDFTMVEATDNEKQWLENLRNLVFKVRYDSDSGWIPATQTCLRRLVAFGNAFMMVEDSLDSKALVRYRPLPLPQSYADENHQGVIDTFYWVFELTARQAIQKYGNKVSQRIKNAAESSKNKDETFRFIQAIHPRADYGHSYEGVKRSPWASCHVEEESRLVVQESGYYDFPIIDFRWLPEPGCVYGEGPVMKCLADIQSLNVMAKNELTASDQAVRPPLLVANAGVVNQPSVNPGTTVVGGISPDGKQLVQPMNLGQRLDFHTLVLEAKRNQVKESLYINLFALLVQNPQMSATEALIRANEKGELLGPSGSRIQQSLSNCVERELGILQRRGLYDRGSAFEVPRTLRNRNIGPQMSGPLNRLRRTKEAEGTVRVLQVMSPLAQVEPEVVDNFDGDSMARELTEIFGAPRKILRTQEAVAERRAQRARAQQQAQNAALAEQMANAGKLGGEALAQLQGL